MSAATFVARHCGETFEGVEGAADFEAHMVNEHHHKRLSVHRGDPIPWRPPRRTASVQQVALAWHDEVEFYEVDERQEIAA